MLLISLNWSTVPLVCVNFKSANYFNSKWAQPHWDLTSLLVLPSPKCYKFVGLDKFADSDGEKTDPC